MRSRHRAVSAVYGLVVEAGAMILLRRAGSGFRDGMLSLPAGHVEAGESMTAALCRELGEELSITVEPTDCRLLLTMHRRRESPDDEEYVDLVFAVDRWTGTPTIGEPDKASELLRLDPAARPRDLVDYHAAALDAIACGDVLLELGW